MPCILPHLFVLLPPRSQWENEVHRGGSLSELTLWPTRTDFPITGFPVSKCLKWKEKYTSQSLTFSYSTRISFYPWKLITKCSVSSASLGNDCHKLSSNTNFFLLKGLCLFLSKKTFYSDILNRLEQIWDKFFFFFTGFIPLILSGPGDLKICIAQRNKDVSLTLFPFGLII